ncbi:MAG: glycosyltransferase family 4 protein [Candidatus Pacebacteria bacterium]|nr:glycosyltransferase family 4 protein [Candidatus Paceibacterota bacterium]
MDKGITLIGTLPPIKGISDTCLNQVQYLTNYIDVNFIGFKSIYPDFLYPGGSSKEKDVRFHPEEKRNLKIRDFLTWYNPFSWIWAGYSAKGEIIHFHWWTSYLFPIFFTIELLAKFRGKQLICEVHNILGHESNWLDKSLNRLIFNLSDYIIVHSEKNKKQLEEFFGKKNNVSVIPLGVLDFFNDTLITKTESREKLGVNNEDKIILSFGNIRGYKGIDILIKSFAKVKQIIPKAKLFIVGKNWIEWQPFQQLIKNYNLEDSVITDLNFIPTSKVKYYFVASDLIVLPYLKFEAQSGPGRIALAFGKAMVVTEVGGLPDLVRDRSVIVEPNNSGELAQAIIKVLQDNNYREKLEADSKELAQKYSWDKISEKIAELYKNIL